MNGAESLLRTLLDNGIDVCFMNPGTSEMQFVSALDRVPAMRGVLCLFEGVCSGAADGYARMTGRPAATLLHLGPGLANGLANFHNARKARSPIVNIVGEHSTQHLSYDAPLTADTALFARTVSGWTRVVASADRVGADAAEAVAAAIEPPGQVATLIVPADFSWSEGGAPGGAVETPVRRPPAAERVREAARILRGPEPAALLLGGRALLARGLAAAGRVTGRVFANRYAARLERGAGLFAPRRLPYFPEAAEEALARLKHLVLVESPPPVTFFGYPGRRSCPAPDDCQVHVLAAENEDGTAALEMPAASGLLETAPPARPALPAGAPLTAETAGMTLGALLPEGAIVSDEMVSSGEGVWPHLAGAPPHDYLPVTGGSIGQGLPVALGAALACPDRKVIALEADGSGMYTLQALWTMARERADVVTVIFANRRYRILDIEMRRTGAGQVGPRANDMLDLARPHLDWVRLAEGHGVAASRASTADEFIAQLRDALRERGPRLIEAQLG
ncbi:MAG: acetolactate synthase large subunit [Acidobacteria bacterium]|nr:acetolactate synthase large subunit [Acidobacteriota bacterium]